MKKLIVLLFILPFFGCSFNTHDSALFYERKGTIVEINNDSSSMQKTYPRAEKYASVLIRDVLDTTLFVELSDNENNNNFIEKEWYNKHKINDTVFFDHILKSRYVHIKKKILQMEPPKDTI